MPALSSYARLKKIKYFLDPIPKADEVLEIGCGSKWVGQYLNNNGWSRYHGMDLVPPADTVGDIRDWQELGLNADHYDWIIAFEVVEHVDLYAAVEALLKPGGKLLVTTPLPSRDWVMKMLEAAKLNQQRTSPHSNLHKLANVGNLELVDYKVVGGLSQWGVLQKK